MTVKKKNNKTIINMKSLTRLRHYVETQESKYGLFINGVSLTVIKWKEGYFTGSYAIYSDEILFNGSERYGSMKDVIWRLNQLNNKEKIWKKN